MPAPSDLVHETSTTIGTGNFTVVSVNGKRTFNTAFGTGGTNVFDYYISNRDAAEWERGTGHLSAATTLVRDTVLASSNAGAAVNFSAGTKDITNDVPAANQARLDAANIFTAIQAVYANNTSTTPILKVEQDDTGDAAFTWLLSGSTQWTAGIDNSVAGDPWKLSASAALGTTDLIQISTGGNFGLNNATTGAPSNTPQTTKFDYAGLIKSTQGGTGSDGCFQAAADGYFSGANWSGNVMFGFNLIAHSTGSADKYRTPNTHASNGYTAIDIIAGSIRFYGTTAASTAGADVTPTVNHQFGSDGTTYFPTLGTTASAANAFLNSASSPANQLLRSTSSRKYKTAVRDIDGNDVAILDRLRPIKYRSKATADDPMKEHFGLIAEEVYLVDPRLIHFSHDDSGNPVPDGVQYERIIPLLLAKIAQLESRITALEAV